MTIHTVVVYYVVEGVEGIQHKSFEYLSPVDKHNSLMVFCILKLMFHRDFPRVFKDMPINLVHYVTDGPSSQYKCSFAYWMISNHKELFGTPAMWHYLESGHGKGPCDGVGGSLKRNAHKAIAKGKTVRNAPTMYTWSSARETSTISYSYVDVYDYAIAYYDRSHMYMKVKYVPGLRKLHSVTKGIDNNTVMQRETTCSCPTCRRGIPSTTCGWTANWTKVANKIIEECDKCHAPLCVCLTKISKLRYRFLRHAKILQVPGKLLLN